MFQNLWAHVVQTVIQAAYNVLYVSGLPVICKVLEADSPREFCGESVMVSATIHLLWTLTSSDSIQKPA
jgi:hypothetical protein